MLTRPETVRAQQFAKIHGQTQFPLIPAPRFATTIREANVTFGATNWWRAWEASPIVSCGETNSWRAWEANSR